MRLFSQINLLMQIHFHIEHKRTGTPKAFACRLHLSERSLYRILEELKDMDVNIIYNSIRCSYEYQGAFRIPDLMLLKDTRKDGMV